MATYRLSSPTVVDDGVDELHEYHADISDTISTELHGLTGMGNRIKTVAVGEQLSNAEKSDLEASLGVSIEQV